MTQWQPGMTITALRLMDGITPTETTTGATAGTGWAISAFTARKIGKEIFINLLVTNVSATVAASANTENIVGDPTVATLPDGWRPTESTGCAWDNGVVNGQAIINADGTVQLRTISYNQSITTNSNVRISKSFIAT